MTRRARLADAAIAVLAERGLRGLTHRAVDQAADVPPGSTSYYYRTRSALPVAVAARLTEVDTADVPVQGVPPPRRDAKEMGADTAGVIEHWMNAGRDRMLARWELALESTRRPELRDTLVAAGTGMRGMA